MIEGHEEEDFWEGPHTSAFRRLAPFHRGSPRRARRSWAERVANLAS